MQSRISRAVGVAACMLVLGAGQATAATLLLRSGERVTGTLLDLNGSGFVIEAAGGERTVPQGDVVVVDFVGGAQGLPDSEVSAVRDGEHLLILKGSQSFRGRLVDFTGSPLRAVFRTDGGDREFTVDEIGRLYLARPAASTPVVEPAPDPPPPTEGLAVPATQTWTPTAITVRRDEMVRFSATGEIGLSGDAEDVAGPAGSLQGRFAPGAPLPRALAGALIGRIGNGQPFAIGDQAQALGMPGTGRLSLGINDAPVSDNRGEFRVVVVKEPGLRRR